MDVNHPLVKIAKDSVKDSAKLQLDAIKQLSNSPFNKSPKPGYMRGIDFYPESELYNTVANSIFLHCYIHGDLPNIITPSGFNEKIIYSKFFTEFKIPESGNKLLTSKFIPKSLEKEITCADVVWRSTQNLLPRNDEIEPGFYYLKSNHGSGMFKRISYPLNEDEFPGLESTTKSWLDSKYGLVNGEWWYSVFPKEIFLEREIIPPDDSISWMFYVMSGKVEFIALYRKTELVDEATWFDKDFNILFLQNPNRPRVKNLVIEDSLKARLLSLATVIGSQFQFIRVDFLLDKNNLPFLGEMTFTPGNGLTARPKVLDLFLGQQWKIV